VTVISAPKHVRWVFAKFDSLLMFCFVRVCGPVYISSRYSDSLRTGRSRDRIPMVGARFFVPVVTCPVGPPSLLCSRYRVSFPGVKRPGRGVDHPPQSSAEVEERVEIYRCSPPLGHNGLFQGELNLFIGVTFCTVVTPNAVEQLFCENPLSEIDT
jgi:hypothetical protein